MSYLEVVRKALKGRSVYAASRDWNVPQKTLDRYSKGERLPDYTTALMIAEEAGISGDEMLKTLAQEEQARKQKIGYNSDRADVAQLVEQLIRNQ